MKHFCKYCNIEFTTGNKLGGHVARCANNPNYADTVERTAKSCIGRKLSIEHKTKISKSITAFLVKNPDRVPYRLNHYANGRSYPERYFKKILDLHNIIYVEDKPISVYNLDFAIVNNKIDLEIDGDQHHVDARIINSDRRRTEFLRNVGWKTVRIRWSAYQRLSKDGRRNFISAILKILR